MIDYYKQLFTQFILNMGGGGSDPGAINRIIEQQREAKVEANRKRVNEIFDGAPIVRTGVNQVTEFDEGRDYYDAEGNVINPGVAKTNYNTSLDQYNTDLAAWNAQPATTPGVTIRGRQYSAPSDRGAQPTAPNQPKFYSDVEETGGGGFDDEYFGGIADAYVKFQNPLLEEQIQEARRIQPSTYATTRSSAYLRGKGLLEKQYGREQVDIADRGQDFANQHRIEVERNRSDILNLANSTTDSSAIARAANARVASLSTPPVYSPIGDLFQKFTQSGAQAVQANQIGNIVSKLNYGASKGSVRTVS